MTEPRKATGPTAAEWEAIDRAVLREARMRSREHFGAATTVHLAYLREVSRSVAYQVPGVLDGTSLPVLVTFRECDDAEDRSATGIKSSATCPGLPGAGEGQASEGGAAMKVPRRNRTDEMVPAELAITNAMYEVERIGASVALTEAVVLLGKARDRVADHVDAQVVHTTCTTSTGPLPLCAIVEGVAAGHAYSGVRLPTAAAQATCLACVGALDKLLGGR